MSLKQSKIKFKTYCFAGVSSLELIKHVQVYKYHVMFRLISLMHVPYYDGDSNNGNISVDILNHFVQKISTNVKVLQSNI